MSSPEPSLPSPPQLPRRDPHPLWVHAAVDIAVAFLSLALLFWIIALPFWLTIVVSVLGGLAAAPFTRGAEERALAERPEAPS